jgi:selenocysteine-specific elongation factor
VLVQGPAWRAGRVLRADVALLADAPRELGPRSRVRLHLGTSEVSARLVVPGGVLAPGDRASARVVVDEPIVARAGDRFVLRSASPVATLGGGVVLDPMAPARARAWPADDRSPELLLRRVVQEAGAAGLNVAELPVRLGISPARIAAALRELDAWRVGDRLVAWEAREALAAQAVGMLDGHHAREPLEPGAPIQWLRSRLRAPDEIGVALLAALAAEGVVVMEQGLVRRAGFTPRLSAEQETVRVALLRALENAGQEPPTLDELAISLGVPASLLATIARHLARDGALVAVEPTRYYPASTVTGLLGRLSAGMGPGQEYGPAELRELLGFSRKFLIPFLEFTDRAGHTVRDPGGRRRRGAT